MRDRLIELIKQGDKTFADKYTGKVMSHIDEIYDFIADHLLANGVVCLPCKVGDTVYEIQPIRKRVQAYEITTIKYNGHYWWFTWILKDRKGIYGNVDGFSSHQIGKTVFLTREEAERALMLDINETFIAEESTYSMPYHELDDIRAFVRNHEWEDIPESIKEHLEKWEEFLVDNL